MEQSLNLYDRGRERDHRESSKREARANGDSVIHSANPSTGALVGYNFQKVKMFGLENKF